MIVWGREESLPLFFEKNMFLEKMNFRGRSGSILRVIKVISR